MEKRNYKIQCYNALSVFTDHKLLLTATKLIFQSICSNLHDLLKLNQQDTSVQMTFRTVPSLAAEAEVNMSTVQRDDIGTVHISN